MKLYEIATALSMLNRLDHDNLEQEDLDKLNQELTEANLSLGIKAQNIIHTVKNLEHYCAGLEEAEKQFKAKRKKIESNIEHIKDYLINNMQMADVNKITCDLFTITMALGSGSVIVEDLELLPDEYVRVKIEKSADKIKIKEDMKEGVIIKGCSLQRKPRLTIK